MANRLKLNEKILRDAEPQEGNSYQIFDTEILGLAAKVQSSGSRTFTLDYRYAIHDGVIWRTPIFVRVRHHRVDKDGQKAQ